ncbi:hypothetical protein CFOL_v3_08688 [Cephalotus follicularis]|uniref:Uncharacterized protein n=1 Tax=Cephalotus follicularis TaxID=3775 RepID=A0A1Q3BBM2_CEPFO|nr:hypothetical protein CFOL_v3_08688 [Cephalotus follicularis]
MEDDKAINGVASPAGDDQTADNFFDVDETTELTRRIEGFEKEKRGLIGENQEIKERIERLAADMEEVKGREEEMKERLRFMESETEESEDDKKVLESIAARAADLETEVSRLQHDLISTLSEVEEANVEISALKRVLGEKDGKIEVLEREIEGLRKDKADNERKERELERKLGVLEVREIEERSKRIRVEEEMRERIDEKEREVSGFKKKVEGLEFEVANNWKELETLNLEKKCVEEALRESQEKAGAMEFKMIQLQKEAEDAEKVIGGLKERTAEVINGTAAAKVMNRVVNDGEEGGLKLQWPVLAAGSTGVIAAAAAVVYVCYLRRS